MTDMIENLISLLREELTNYGEMLALFDQQQAYVMDRSTDDLLQSVIAIQSQSEVTQKTRRQREGVQRKLAAELGTAAEPDFDKIIPRLPNDYRPLVGALVDENNNLLTRVQQRARQNHTLLSRSVELMQDFMNDLFPGQTTNAYTQKGTRTNSAPSGRMLYEALG